MGKPLRSIRSRTPSQKKVAVISINSDSHSIMVEIDSHYLDRTKRVALGQEWFGQRFAEFKDLN
jgi:hypothetical protein